MELLKILLPKIVFSVVMSLTIIFVFLIDKIKENKKEVD